MVIPAIGLVLTLQKRIQPPARLCQARKGWCSTIRHNAIKFSREWTGVKSESAEKQTFWNEFFQVFGIKRRVVASFEEAVKKISGDYGRIDLFWPGVLLVEHKSFGEDLRKAETQAFAYIRNLANDPARRDEIPRYIIVSDFARIALHDLEPEEQRDLPLFDKKRGITHEFPLADFHRHVQHFAFIPGYKQHTLQEEDPVTTSRFTLHTALLHGQARRAARHTFTLSYQRQLMKVDG